MDQTDASNEQDSAKQILKNIQKIRAIEIGDLEYLEDDLDFYEKVSMLFLLCGADRIRSKVVIQQIIIASYDKQQKTTFLKTWASENVTTNWKDTLLEALCIIQAKTVIRKLGIDVSDLEERFLPRNPVNALFIHPIIKLLYYVCDKLTINQTNMFIEQIKRKYPSVRDFSYNDNGENLEVYLLYWIWEDVISIGQISTTENPEQTYQSRPCNLEPIVEYLKQAEMDTVQDVVKDVTHKFNCEQSMGKVETIAMRKTQMDDKRATEMEMSDVSRSFDERTHTVDAKHSYKLRKEYAGHVLIINQLSFYHDTHPDLNRFLPNRSLETRHGTDKDTAFLQNTFTAFGYRIVIKENLKHTDILNAVKNVVNQSVGMDSIMVCILSHGYKGVVYGSNSIPVKIEDIQNIMISKYLIGKPKILIIQACQGDETQQAREIDYLRHDGPTMSLPLYSDLLTCISTVPGFTSIRHTEKGSWFIQTLCQKLKELANKKHFIDILTVVCREVLNKRGRNNQCMVPIYHSTLRMDLYMPTT